MHTKLVLQTAREQQQQREAEQLLAQLEQQTEEAEKHVQVCA